MKNLLATRGGRLVAFFFLYLTEGIPLGFLATAIVTNLRRAGTGTAEIGAFVGALYLPWAFKWALGPIVDVFSTPRLGRRRMWIVLAQSVMVITLLSTIGLELPAQLKVFTAIILVHNLFAAAQDVAIDSLAVNVLAENERGLANGVMFGGASLGQVLGGAGVLFLSEHIPFQGTFFFVAGCIASVTLLIALPLKEPEEEPAPRPEGSRLAAAAVEMRTFAENSFLAILGSRGAFVGLFLALLPAGAMSLGLALQNNLAVDLGFEDAAIGRLQLFSGSTFCLFCMLGGFFSDRFGRRRMLAIYIALSTIPGILMATRLGQHEGPMAENNEGLILWFWIAVLLFSCFNGLMYGTRSALYMDVTNPRVAGTQFTAYMALLNLVIAYTAIWQGIAIETWGYGPTLLADAAFGLVCLALLPFMTRPGDDEPSGGTARRGRALAVALALVLLTFVPYRSMPDTLATARPILDTFFTLAFVFSGVFLLAGSALLRNVRRDAALLSLSIAPFTFLMHARYSADVPGFLLASSGGSLAAYQQVVDLFLYGVPVAVACWLLYLAVSRVLDQALED